MRREERIDDGASLREVIQKQREIIESLNAIIDNLSTKERINKVEHPKQREIKPPWEREGYKDKGQWLGRKQNIL